MTPRSDRPSVATWAIVALIGAIVLLGTAVAVGLIPSSAGYPGFTKSCGRVLLPPWRDRTFRECNHRLDLLTLRAGTAASAAYVVAVIAGFGAGRIKSRAAWLARLAGNTYVTLALIGIKLAPLDKGDPLTSDDDHVKLWVIGAAAVVAAAGIAFAVRDAAHGPSATRAFKAVVAGVRTAAFGLAVSIAFNTIWIVSYAVDSD